VGPQQGCAQRSHALQYVSGVNHTLYMTGQGLRWCRRTATKQQTSSTCAAPLPLCRGPCSLWCRGSPALQNPSSSPDCRELQLPLPSDRCCCFCGIAVCALLHGAVSGIRCLFTQKSYVECACGLCCSSCVTCGFATEKSGAATDWCVLLPSTVSKICGVIGTEAS